MAKKNINHPDVIRQLMDYDPATGILTWKVRGVEFFMNEASMKRWNTRYAGTEALACDHDGYKSGSLLKDRHLKAHRAAFVHYHGRYPDGHIDHINGDTTDNRICNLREVTHTQNQRNMKMNHRNKSGKMGVFRIPSGAWWSYIGSGKSRKTIGYFSSLEDAIQARKDEEARQNYHANHGRVTFADS